MWRIFALSTALCLATSVALGGSHGSATNACAADGSSGAPSGPAPYPVLLASYSAVPTCAVAGVTYSVGLPSGTVLNDPLSVTLPGGVTRNASTHILTITAAGVTLSNLDLSLEGGWQIVCGAGCSNPTITLNNWGVGANLNPFLVVQGAASGGGTIADNTLDGANVHPTGQNGILNIFGTGTWTIQYNWLKNSAEDFINAGSASQSQNITWNLFDNNGCAIANGSCDAGGHPDWLQDYGLGNIFPSVIFNYNTVRFSASGQATQGLNFRSGASTAQFASLNFSNNTFVLSVAAGSPTPNVNHVIDVDPSDLGLGVGSCTSQGTATISGNYIDPTSITGGAVNWLRRDSSGIGPCAGTITTTGNINMTTGGALP